MSERPASPPPRAPASDDLALGLPVVDVTAGVAGSPPEWIKIAPRGELKCRDGRVFTLDPDAIVARNKAEAVKVPIDVGHGVAKDDRAPAIGWAEELEARPDGLFGRIDWLPAGRQVLSDRTHRYVSPAFHHDAKGAATWLHSIALVAAPALAGMPALASALPPASIGVELPALSAALGLPKSADEATCLAALSTSFVPIAVYESAMALLSASHAETRQLVDERRSKAAETLLETALKEKRVVPAERATLLAMCSTDAGLASVTTLVGMRPPILFASPLEGRKAPEPPLPATPAQLAARANALVDERRIRFDEAMVIAMAEPARPAQ